MTFLAAMSVLIVGALCVQLSQLRRRQKRSTATWDDLLRRAAHIDFENIRRIADSYFHPEENQFLRQPAEMWKLLGGTEGLNRLYRNAEIMLELALFAERWQNPDAALVAELVRRDGLRLKKLVTRMQLSIVMQRAQGSFGFDVQEAAATYCQMRQRLVGLYETCHVARVPALVAAV